MSAVWQVLLWHVSRVASQCFCKTVPGTGEVASASELAWKCSAHLSAIQLLLLLYLIHSCIMCSFWTLTAVVCSNKIAEAEAAVVCCKRAIGIIPSMLLLCETVPGTGEVARFPAETLGTHKDGNTAYTM
jgi:hypothetical protein